MSSNPSRSVITGSVYLQHICLSSHVSLAVLDISSPYYSLSRVSITVRHDQTRKLPLAGTLSVLSVFNGGAPMLL